MSSKQTIGIDTAKRVFFLHGEDARGRVILPEKLTRERLVLFLANQPVSLVAIEAGCGAHHWARALAPLGRIERTLFTLCGFSGISHPNKWILSSDSGPQHATI